MYVCVCVCTCYKPTFLLLQIPTTTVELQHLLNLEGKQLITSEHIAIFVVNTLFSAIVEATKVSVTTVPEKMRVWFKAYR